MLSYLSNRKQGIGILHENNTKKTRDSTRNRSTIKPFGQRVSELQGTLSSTYNSLQVTLLFLTSKYMALGDTNKR